MSREAPGLYSPEEHLIREAWVGHEDGPHERPTYMGPWDADVRSGVMQIAHCVVAVVAGRELISDIMVSTSGPLGPQ